MASTVPSSFSARSRHSTSPARSAAASSRRSTPAAAVRSVGTQRHGQQLQRLTAQLRVAGLLRGRDRLPGEPDGQGESFRTATGDHGGGAHDAHLGGAARAK